MSPMSVEVGVVVVALVLEDAKAHADDARADDAPSEALIGSPQQVPPVVQWLVCQVLVCEACVNALRAKCALPLAGGPATQPSHRVEPLKVCLTENNRPSRLSSATCTSRMRATWRQSKLSSTARRGPGRRGLLTPRLGHRDVAGGRRGLVWRHLRRRCADHFVWSRLCSTGAGPKEGLVGHGVLCVTERRASC